jgi:hypothetical protein
VIKHKERTETGRLLRNGRAFSNRRSRRRDTRKSDGLVHLHWHRYRSRRICGAPPLTYRTVMTANPPGCSERSPPRFRTCLSTIRKRSTVDCITTARIDAQTPPSDGDRSDTMVPKRQDSKHRRTQACDHGASPARQRDGIAHPSGMFARKIGNVSFFRNRRDDRLERRNGNGRQMRRAFLRIYSTQRVHRLAVSRAPPDGAAKRVEVR